MKFDCPSCGAKYKISDEKLADKKEIKVRCKKCNFLIRQKVEIATEPSPKNSALESDLQATRVINRDEIAKMREKLESDVAPAAESESVQARQQETQTWYVFLDDKQVGPIEARVPNARTCGT